MLAFSFFGPSREVTVKWINELQQYIGARVIHYVLVIGHKTFGSKINQTRVSLIIANYSPAGTTNGNPLNSTVL